MRGWIRTREESKGGGGGEADGAYQADGADGADEAGNKSYAVLPV